MYELRIVKGSSDQNHSSSDLHNPIKKIPPCKISHAPHLGRESSIPLKTIWKIM